MCKNIFIQLCKCKREASSWSEIWIFQVIEMSGVCAASDIWSVGCTVIELLTCVPPYYDLQPMPALFRIVQVCLSVFIHIYYIFFAFIISSSWSFGFFSASDISLYFSLGNFSYSLMLFFSGSRHGCHHALLISIQVLKVSLFSGGTFPSWLLCIHICNTSFRRSRMSLTFML